MKSSLKWTVIVLAAALLLVLVGADPFLGTPQVFRSGVMLGLLGVLALLCLWALVKKHLNRPLLSLAHLGCLLMAIGATLDFATEKKLNFGMYVGKQHESDQVYDEAHDVTIPVGFNYCITDFHVEYYPDTYTLHTMEGQQVLLKESAKEENGQIRFTEANITIPSTQMDGKNMLLLPDAKHVVARKGGLEKNYSANFLLNGELHDFGVNRPITYNGWKFYMMSHGRAGTQQYVRMIARNAPGRVWMILGITLLLIGCTAWCWKPRKNLV